MPTHSSACLQTPHEGSGQPGCGSRGQDPCHRGKSTLAPPTATPTFSVLQGKDSTVFFLSVENNYEPIGFVKTPSPVTTIQWAQDKPV